MSHRVSRKTFRHFELRQRRDLARFKAEVLDAVAKMTPPAERVIGTLHFDDHSPVAVDGLEPQFTVTYGNGEADA